MLNFRLKLNLSNVLVRIVVVKYQEVQSQSVSELYDRLYQLKKALLNIRVQRSTGTVSNTSQIRKNRCDVARIKTRLVQMNKK
jgi:ribosomal protein L29